MDIIIELSDIESTQAEMQVGTAFYRLKTSALLGYTIGYSLTILDQSNNQLYQCNLTEGVNLSFPLGFTTFATFLPNNQVKLSVNDA